MKQKYRNVLISGGIVAVILIAAALILGINSVSMAAYNDMIKEADLMMEQKDYAGAIAKYQEAINDKPEKEDGYVKLIGAYHASGHPDYASQLLKHAIAKFPNSDNIKKLGETLGITEGVEAEKKETVVALQLPLIEAMGSKSYYDYESTDSVEKVTPGESGSFTIRIRGVAANLIYRNTAGQPKAVSTDSPLPDSLPAEVVYDDIMTIFGGGDRITIDELKALVDKDGKKMLDNVKLVKHQEYGSAVTFTVANYRFEIECDKEGTISSGNKNRMYVPEPGAGGGGKTELTGVVTDAVTGDPVEGVEITVLPGRASDKEIKVTSDSSGNYKVMVGSGECTLECEAEGYIAETKSVFVPTYSSEYEFEIVLSPDDGEIRFVLTWGSYPADLDSYLVGEGIEVSFRNPNAGGIADLDRDDIDGHGPETITLHNINGSFKYYVHDYHETGMIAESDAQVTVYLPGKEPQTISINGDSGPDNWVVCEVENGSLNVINDIRDEL